MRDSNNKKNFNSIEDVNEHSEKLLEKFLNVMETYEKQVGTESYLDRLDYTVAAIYLSLKKVFPEGVSFRIDYRTKSFRSIQKSTDSEIMRSTLDKLKKDIFGMKVIITDIDGKLNFDTTDPQLQRVIELQEEKMNNMAFITKTREWLATSSDTMPSEENYYKTVIDLLTRLTNSTYAKCIRETEIPYSTRLTNTKKLYEVKQKDDTLALTFSKSQASELETLLDDLERRLDDKFERELLKVYLPKALSSNLLSNMLQTTYKYDKETIKPTGYVADFYNLNVGNEFSIELQSQSYLRYLDGKKGPSFHNGMLGKGIQIFSFFELIDKDDPQPLEYYLKILAQMPSSLYEEATIDGTQTGMIEKVSDAYSHIKLKDTIKFSDNENASLYDMDQYLLKLAEYVSANASICRSAHNFSIPTVNIENANLLDSFSDVLRKRDGISCLAQILVDKVENILEANNDDRLHKHYKQITTRDIVNYSKTLPQSPEKNIVEK